MTTDCTSNVVRAFAGQVCVVSREEAWEIEGDYCWTVALDDRYAPDLPAGVRIGVDRAAVPRFGDWVFVRVGKEESFERWPAGGTLPKGYELCGVVRYRGDELDGLW